MPIDFQCQCGRKLRTSDANAGRSATCPQCRSRFVVPAASMVPAAAPACVVPPLPEAEPVEAAAAYPADSEEVTPVQRRPAAPSSPYGWSDRDDPGDPDDSRPRRRRPYRDDDIRSRIVRKPSSPSSQFMGGAGVLGGLAMMAIAVVWFFGAGLMFDVWFIYPPFLFIAGLVCLIRGCATGKM